MGRREQRVGGQIETEQLDVLHHLARNVAGVPLHRDCRDRSP